MPVKVYISTLQVPISMDEPVKFPEAPLVGVVIDVMCLMEYKSEERSELRKNLENRNLKEYGKVVERHWSCKNFGDEPDLFITLKLDSL